MVMIEEPLVWGRSQIGTSLVTDSLLGPTVRKQATRSTPAIHALLTHLSNVGFTGAPRSFGIDDQGRHVLEYVPGRMADTRRPFTADELTRLGELVRDLHDAVSSFIPPADAVWTVAIPTDRDELISHHDLAPWNLVLDGDRWVIIDWDGAGPGARLWDLAHVAHGFLPLHPDGDPAEDGARLRALVDGYGLTAAQRPDLVQVAADQTRGMFSLLVDGARTGTEPWATLHAAGHSNHWGPVSEYIRRNRGVLRAALR